MPAQQSALATMLGLHGDNPDTLDLIDINPTQVQRDTISGNLENAPRAFDLASLANQFSSDEMLKMLEKMLPGYSAMRDKVTSNIGSYLRGEIPGDVQRLIEQRAAEKGFTTGTSGSEFRAHDLVRSLGLTSLDITQKGLDSAARWIAAVPKAPQFDYTSMFFTPQQRLNYEFQQAQANLPIRSFNNWVNSLPSNLERGAGQLLDWVAQTGSSILEMYAGGAVGGGAGLGGMMGGMMGGGGGSGSVNKSPGGAGYSPDFYNYGPQ